MYTVGYEKSEDGFQDGTRDWATGKKRKDGTQKDDGLQTANDYIDQHITIVIVLSFPV